MNSLPYNNFRICPECGAEIPSKYAKCWICHSSLPQDATLSAEPPVLLASLAEDSTAARPQAVYEHRATFQFGLSSIMLIITLAAVILGVYQMAPGLGIALAILAIPALIRTCIISMRKGAYGRPISSMEKIGTFVVWLGVAAIVVAAAGIAFFVTCLATFATHPRIGPEGLTDMAPVVLGGIAALVVAVLLSILFWRKFGK